MTLQHARLWRRAAVDLIERELEVLKAPLADPNIGSVNPVGIQRYTEHLAWHQQLAGESLVQAYEARRREYPLLVRMMVRAQAASDRAVLSALWREETA
jgi:hypothetical protein